MTPQTFKELLAGYYSGTLTDRERIELSAMLHDPQHSEELKQLFTEDLADPDFQSVADTESLELVYQQIQLQKQAMPVRRIFPYRRVAAAAAVILLMATGTYFLFFYPSQKPGIVRTQDVLKNDIEAPAFTKAVLKLMDGKEIVLDTATNSQLAVQENAAIVKTGDGQLIYKINHSSQADGSVHMNTLAVPRGSRPVQLTLTDGTTVWLNAASSITYPVVFSGSERKVQMSGEAYYEVAKDPARKFYVSASGLETEVLGTHFNVNAYEDEEQKKVTLLEGAIKVSKNGQLVALKPGQQARLTGNLPDRQAGNIPITINSIDAEEAVAWKDGYFDFRGIDIKSVMRQLTRWYNVEVEYNGKITDNHFSGIINRDNNISQVLKMLQSTGGVVFKIETGSSSAAAGKIIVLP